MKARAHLYISGIVQGVFYRAFTRDIANSLGLSGWVRNLYDGRVEAVFEGEKDLIDIAIKRCHQGPQGARVTNVSVTWEDQIEGLSDFRIRY